MPITKYVPLTTLLPNFVIKLIGSIGFGHLSILFGKTEAPDPSLKYMYSKLKPVKPSPSKAWLGLTRLELEFSSLILGLAWLEQSCTRAAGRAEYGPGQGRARA